MTGKQIADAAITSGLIGTPYSKLDCQALVEEVLKRAKLPIINYRGSNHMWRELVYDRKPIADGVILPGMLAFIVRDDGGEKRRGYRDDMKNATHVAIALGDGTVFESTTGGVQISSIRRFTHVAKIIDVDYSMTTVHESTATRKTENYDKIKAELTKLKIEIEIVLRHIASLEESQDDN